MPQAYRQLNLDERRRLFRLVGARVSKHKASASGKPHVKLAFQALEADSLQTAWL